MAHFMFKGVIGYNFELYEQTVQTLMGLLKKLVLKKSADDIKSCGSTQHTKTEVCYVHLIVNYYLKFDIN